MAFVKSMCYDSDLYANAYELSQDKLIAAAEKNDMYAMTVLAIKLREEEAGYPYEPARALALLQNAAGMNFAPAQIILAESYRDGVGIPQNDALAIKWFQKAIERGAISAYMQLGLIYLRSPKTEAAAVDLLLHAAENDDTNAMYFMANLYREGRVVEHDPYEGFKWMQKAAGQNDDLAQVTMAYMLMVGEGCNQDEYTAVPIMKKWAEAEHPEALYFMAQMYLKGIGVEQDFDKGQQCLELSAELGHEKAIVMLAEYSADS